MPPTLLRTRYDRFSQLLHWLTAIAVTIAFILGPGGFGRMIKQGIDPATRLDILWHETLGVTVFVLTVVRLLWVARRPARQVIEQARWMAVTARLMHLALWTLLVALPVTAVLALGTENHPMTLLGGIRFDRLPVTADSAIAKMADWGEVHGLLGDVLIWLAGAHALAGLFHHFVLKDGVLRAMLPGRDVAARP